MRFYVLWGFLLWVVVAVALRLAGPVLLDPDRPVIVVLTFLLAVPLVIAGTYPVYRWRRTSLPDRPLAALLVALPGLALSAVSLLLLTVLFGNLADVATRYFAAWLFWAYGLILVTGFIAEPQARRV